MRDEARSADKPPSSFLQVANTTRELQLNSKRFEYLHFIIYISGALQLAPDTSCGREAAGARIPLAGTPDTDFFFFLEGRALKKLLINYSTVARDNARARGRVSWKHRPSVSTTARSRARPAVQSALRWEMEVYVEPAVARAECGSGVRLLNNVAEFISTFRRNPLRVFTCCDGTAGRFSSAGSCTRSDHPQAKNNEVWGKLPAVERLKVLFKGALSKIWSDSEFKTLRQM